MKAWAIQRDLFESITCPHNLGTAITSSVRAVGVNAAKDTSGQSYHRLGDQTAPQQKRPIQSPRRCAQVIAPSVNGPAAANGRGRKNTDGSSGTAGSSRTDDSNDTDGNRRTDDNSCSRSSSRSAQRL